MTIPEIGVCAYDKSDGKVYDLDSYLRKNPVQLGTLQLVYNKEKDKDEYNFIRL